MISRLKQDEISAAIELLKTAGLPADDISDKTELFSLQDSEGMKGLVGLEVYNRYGLLRSLCITPSLRGKGQGTELVNFIEREAAQRDVKTMYLLTTTASGLFAKLGYELSDRSEIPDDIRNTSQFSAVCPSTATVMHKSL